MQNFIDLAQGNIFKFLVEWMVGVGNSVQKLAISRKRWEIKPKLLLLLPVIGSGIRHFRLHENHWPCM